MQSIKKYTDSFKKAVEAIHIAPQNGPLTLLQRKMYNAMLKAAISQSAESNRTTFTISIAYLIAETGVNTHNTKYIKETINGLIAKVVNWDHLTPDMRKTWRASSLLASVELDRGQLYYTFSEAIREKLLNPEVYAMIDLRVTRKFHRSYSLAIWENIIRYERVRVTAKFPLQQFRDLILGLENGQPIYPEYKIFKRKVLVPSLQEINKNTGRTVELIEYKSKRTVVALQFRFISSLLYDTESTRETSDSPSDLVIEMGKAVNMLPLSLRNRNEIITEKHNTANTVAISKSKAMRQEEIIPPTSHSNTEDKKTINSAAQFIAKQSPAAQLCLQDLYNKSTALPLLQIPEGKPPTKIAQIAFLEWLANDKWKEVLMEMDIHPSILTDPKNPFFELFRTINSENTVDKS